MSFTGYRSISHRAMRQEVHKLIKRGWSCEQLNGGHLRLRAPNGQIVVTSSSPSDPRAVKNLRSLARRLSP